MSQIAFLLDTNVLSEVMRPTRMPVLLDNWPVMKASWASRLRSHTSYALAGCACRQADAKDAIGHYLQDEQSAAGDCL